MASQVENIAKEWLSDPDWAKVYKLNVDVVEDSMNMILFSVGVVLLTLKFTMSFGSGDIACVLEGESYKPVETKLVTTHGQPAGVVTALVSTGL